MEHIRLDGNARVAALEYNSEKVEVLAPKVEEAEQRRNDLREAIRRHEESAHSRAPGED
jgi:hypothetical protein